MQICTWKLSITYGEIGFEAEQLKSEETVQQEH